MAIVRFNFKDGGVDVAPKNGNKWTAEDLKSHIEIANINTKDTYLTTDGGELVVVEHKTGNILVRADEQATEEICDNIAEKVIPIIAEGLRVDESEIEEVNIDFEYAFINFIYDGIEVSYHIYEPCYSTISLDGEITTETIYQLSDFFDNVSMKEEIWDVLPC